MLERFSAWVTRRRWIVLAVLVAATVVFAVALGDIEIRTDFISSMNENLEEVGLYNYIGERFGGSDVAVVLVETDNVFQRKLIRQLRQFTEGVATIPDVRSVNSLTDIIDIRSIEGGVEVGDLVPPGEPPSQAELDELREYVLSKEMYTGLLVSPEAKVTAVLVRLLPEIDRVEVGRRIEALARKTFDDDVRLTFSGLPFHIYYMDQIVLEELYLMTSLVIAVVALVLGLFYRRLAGVLLPLGGVGFALVWTLGIMALAGIPINLMTSALPVVLFAVGAAYAIHVVSRFYHEHRRRDDAPEAVQRTLDHVGLPVLLAALTTIIGFASLLTANIDMITEFGFFSALGVFAAMLIACTLIPALLAIIGRSLKPRLHKDEKNSIPRPSRIADGAALFTVNRPRLISLIALVMALAAAVAVPFVRREVNLLEFFDPDITLRQSERIVEEHFGGSLPAQVYLQGDARDPGVLRRVRRLERFMRAEIGRQTQGLTALLAEVNYNLYGERRIPGGADQINELYFWLEGDELIDSFVADGAFWKDGPAAETVEGSLPRSELLVFSNVGGSDSDLMVTHTASIEEYLRDTLPAVTAEVDTTTLDAADAADVRDHRLETAAFDLLCDLTYRGYRERGLRDAEGEPRPLRFTNDELIRWTAALRAIGAGEAPIVDAAYRAELVEPFLRNFVENSGLIPLENPEDRERLIVALAGSWRDGGPPLPPPDELSAAFTAGLPADYLAAYPDDPAWLAGKTALRFEQKLPRHRVDGWIGALTDELPVGLLDDPDAVTDLRAVLLPLTENTARLPAELVHRITDEDVAGVELRAAQTGFPRIFERMEDQLMTNQLKTLGIAYGLVLVLLMLVMRSPGGGLMTSIPIVLTVLVNFAVMALTGIPLDIVTIIIASLVIGIGVDYTIHFTTGFRRNLRELGGNTLAALKRTLATTGRAVVINATGVALGFLVLEFSQIIPLRQLGVLIAITMLVSTLAALVVLPAIYLTFRPRFIFDPSKRTDKTAAAKGETT